MDLGGLYLFPSWEWMGVIIARIPAQLAGLDGRKVYQILTVEASEERPK